MNIHAIDLINSCKWIGKQLQYDCCPQTIVIENVKKCFTSERDTDTKTRESFRWFVIQIAFNLTTNIKNQCQRINQCFCFVGQENLAAVKRLQNELIEIVSLTLFYWQPNSFVTMNWYQHRHTFASHWLTQILVLIWQVNLVLLNISW